ncbi:MAG: TVP38/TMEM64 family protein [Pseudomonadota bacterium]
MAETDAETVEPTVAEMERPIWHRALIIVLLLAALAAAVGLGLQRYLDLAALQAHREELRALVATHWVLVLLVYLVAYAAIVLTSLPGAAIMTVVGGFLFGQILGSLAAAVGATFGACIIFLAARSAFGGWMRRRAGPWLKRVERGFAENGLSFLLVLRLIPLFPFFIVNLVLPFVGLTLRVYMLGTFLGILPASFVYGSFGAGLGAIFDRGEAVTLGSILTPEILMGLTGLGLLALTPVAWKYWRRRRGRPTD